MDPNALKVPELKEELKKRGLEVKGNKKDLVERLEEAMKRAGQEIVRTEKKKRAPPPKRKQKEKEESDEEDASSSDDGGNGGSGGRSEEKRVKPTEESLEKVPYGTVANHLKIVSYNVNGINASVKKGAKEYIAREQPDILCLQETKVNPNDTNKWTTCFGNDYESYWNCCQKKKGYSGTAVFTKVKPDKVSYGIGVAEHDEEGRAITLEYPEFFLVNTYVPNSGMKLERLQYRVTWDAALLAYLDNLQKVKPVVWTGDLNVAHNEIDLATPEKRKNKVPGFCDEERTGFSNVLAAGFIDSWRARNPGHQDFTFWNNKKISREKNLGWRLDYWVVSQEFYPKLGEIFVRKTELCSDHVPVGLLIPN